MKRLILLATIFIVTWKYQKPMRYDMVYPARDCKENAYGMLVGNGCLFDQMISDEQKTFSTWREAHDFIENAPKEMIQGQRVFDFKLFKEEIKK